MSKKGSKTKKVHRDAVTGRFVSEDSVRKHPTTTVTETVKLPSKGKK